ncbi:MAG: glycosyltransferase family 2 protein [Patescibacteria group bacterium]
MKSRLISVIVPFFNEEKNVAELHQRLIGVFKNLDYDFEIVFVDDGSTDATFEAMRSLKPLTALRLRKNFGQSHALAAGIRRSRGDTVVTMDGDLENHPEDIPRLIAKINEGYDVVSGWRKNRWSNQLILRRIPSLAANKLIAYVSGAALNDFGCALRAYRRSVINQIQLKGEEHRLIAANASVLGAHLAEIEVQYSARKSGKSKYGLMRIFKVLLDVLALTFFNRYSSRPIHFFGGFGFAGLFLSLAAFIIMLYLRIFMGISFILTPLPTLAAIFAIIGVQFILMGLLAEIYIRRDKNTSENDFLIKEEIIN